MAVSVGDQAPEIQAPWNRQGDFDLQERLEDGPVVLACYHFAFTGG